MVWKELKIAVFEAVFGQTELATHACISCIISILPDAFHLLKLSTKNPQEAWFPTTSQKRKLLEGKGEEVAMEISGYKYG